MMQTSKKMLLLTTMWMLLSFQHCFAQKSKTTEDQVSVSVSEGDDYYTFSASFSPEKNSKVKAKIVAQYGQANVNQGDIATWTLENTADISLRKGHLSMRIDKDNNNAAQMAKMKQLGENVSEVLNVPQMPEPPSRED